MPTREQKLTQEEEWQLKSFVAQIRTIDAESRLNRLCAELETELEAEGLLNVDMDVLRREKSESRRRDATQFMASRPIVKRPSQRYEAKARVVTKVTHDCQGCHDCYELKKKLPASARKRFEAEYNETSYGEEQQLIDKYVRLYRL